ncbi:MAG: hypothetical protein H0V44_15440 [Planctomycetes bacterium]|nr:hypothetical protein [Planctomycetota bacterium]
MNSNIAALLDLQVIDKQRQVLKLAREARKSQFSEAERQWKASEGTAQGAESEAEKLGALIRQYTADSARCDTTIADLRSKQMNAKTNKDYMAIINGIEAAKVEKGMREASIKEVTARLEVLKDKAAKANEQALKLKSEFENVQKSSGTPDQPSPEEAAIQKQYDDRKAQVDPTFLEVYERLVKARHPMPLAKVDPNSRATPMGIMVSHNQIEQIRMGKLVVCRNSNSILYIAEKAKSDAKG